VTPPPLDGDGFAELTAAIRDRVVAGWAAAPVRFREDANTEEDYALGGYRDRVLVELAQNAADAAVRAGVAGRLLLALRDGVLLAANSGAPLDADGVQALATLRASAKTDAGPDTAGPVAGLVGRFGVGFSAVLAVTDAPEVISRQGGIGFSRARTRALAENLPSLAEELARRGGHVPVLRLPFPTVPEDAEDAVPEGYDTVVRLPIRDAAAEDLLARLLDELDDALLLALPALGEIRLETDSGRRVLSDADRRWITVRQSGSHDAAALADRPIEERARTAWSVAWAVPREPGPLPVTAVLHAPTPTDEPLPWPAMLIAGFPLDPSRRHVAAGPATEALTGHAAQTYADLVARAVEAGTGWHAWDLLPSGFPAGPLDGALREAVPGVLAAAPILVSAETGEPVRPRDAVLIEGAVGADDAAVRALAPSLAGLVLAPPHAASALRALAVHSLALADLVEQLPGGRTPSQWRELYAALAGPAVDPLVREALAALPVPLTDGRLVRGVRGTVVLEAGEPAPGAAGEALAALGVRVVHPEAVHRLLLRCGAQELSAAGALALDEVRAAVEHSLEAAEDGDERPSASVLQLVAAALAAGQTGPLQDGSPGAAGSWSTLALRDVDGEIAPAGELVLPGSTASRLLAADLLAPVAPDLVDRWGADVLRAVGVRDTLVLQRFGDVDLIAEGLGSTDREPGFADLPDVGDWIDHVARRVAAAGAGELDVAAASELVAHEPCAVADLDAVLPHAWPEALATIAADPTLRAAVLDPVRVGVRTPGAPGRSAAVPSWTAWWLRRELTGDRAWADPDADPLVARLVGPPPPLLAALDPPLDPPLRRALGAVVSLEDLDPVALARALDADADPGEPDHEPDLATMLDVWASLGRLAAADAPGLDEVVPPRRLRAVRQGRLTGVDAEEAVVVDRPAWLQRSDLGAAIVTLAGMGGPLADLLDLPLAQELAEGVVDERDVAPTDVPDAVRVLLPAAPNTWCEHEELAVDGMPVTWWVDEPDEPGEAPVVHACTIDGLARALAWAGGAWHLRGAVLAVLDGLSAAEEVLLDEAFSPSR